MRLRDHKGITEGRIDILFAKPGELVIEDGYNVRDLTTKEAREKLDRLKAEIKEHGVQTPLRVRFDGTRIIIVEGHRRQKVVMELLAEFKDSKGADGAKIEAVPIYAEPKGTTELDRDFGLKTSNSGEQLTPLEFANLIYRTIHQRGISEQEAAKGFGVSITVLRNHLKMRAMPEEVKKEVQAGNVSATFASKLARENPEKAAELIRANKEENARIRGKDRRTKVTPKTIARDKPKPAAAEAKAEPQSAPEPAGATEAVPTLGGSFTVPGAAPHESVTTDYVAVAHESFSSQVPITVESMTADVNLTVVHDALYPPTPPTHAVKDLIDALAPFAQILNDTDINQYGDDETILVAVKHLKRAWEVWSKATGDDVKDQAA